MDMILKRTKWLSDGIFGQLQSIDGQFQVDTIEHAYPIGVHFISKIPLGVYICKRRLSPHFGYEVFEVTDVPNCTYIEIHIANTENDVQGCIGVGESLGTLNGFDAVLQSGEAFKNLMALQSGIQTFELTVT